MEPLLSRVRSFQVEDMSKRARPATRRKPVVREFQLQEREKKLLELLDLYPNQVVRGLAVRPEAEWHYGRLYLVGALSKDQYDAACSLDKITRTYRLMIKRYGHVKAAKHEPGSGATREDLSLSAEKKMRKVNEKYREMYGALKECGPKIEKAVIDTLEYDKQSDLELLRNGLSILAAWAR